MKEALWDVIITYLTGNYDEASETLLRMSDLSGAERALVVLGLSRDADEATIKAPMKRNIKHMIIFICKISRFIVDFMHTYSDFKVV